MNNNLVLKNKLNTQQMQVFSSEFENRKKSATITWLLWLFLGGLGAHRYYLGKYGTAVAMTFTLGGLGVWTLIDIFLNNGNIKNQNQKIESEILNEVMALKAD